MTQRRRFPREVFQEQALEVLPNVPLEKGVPKTNQSTKYADYDDGDLQTGLTRTGPRYTDNGDGTITDNATNLMWAKDPSDLGPSWGSLGNPTPKTWLDALELCHLLSLGGHTDWRLPNIKELGSLVNYGRWDPCFGDIYFPNTQSAPYWSSTTYHNITTYAWAVQCADGRIDPEAKATTQYIRPVRGGL